MLSKINAEKSVGLYCMRQCFQRTKRTYSVSCGVSNLDRLLESRKLPPRNRLASFFNNVHYRPCLRPVLTYLRCQSFWFSSASFSPSNDPYSLYRRPITDKMWKEFQKENMNTQRQIDEKLCQELLQEMQHSLEAQQYPPPEIGPSGTWRYQFISDNGSRQYQRTWRDSTQLVFEFDSEVEIHSMSLSVDDNYAACLIENPMDGTKQIWIRQMETNRDSLVTVDPGVVSLELGPILPQNVHSLYLVGSDEQGRPDSVSVSTVDPLSLCISESRTIYRSDDPAVMVDVQRTKGCKYVAIQAMTKVNNEIYLSSDPSTLLLVMPKMKNTLYHLDVGDANDVVILLSKNGGDYEIMETTADMLPLEPNGIIPEAIDANKDEDHHVISDMDLFQGHLVLYERSSTTGLQRITVRHRHSLSEITIPLPPGIAECGKLSPAGNINFRSTSLRFHAESPVTSGDLYEFHFRTNELEQVAATRTIGKDLKRERIVVPSSDGISVPLSMIYRDDDPWASSLGSKDEPRPVVLVGYGAYGEPINLGYDPSWLPLLDRGFVLAFAHTRGGGDLGRQWYSLGCRENKEKGIEDFEHCAKYLKIRWGGALTGKAFSAGGVLVGASMNRIPGLFDNVVLTNAFVDVFATMINPDLFLTSHEWDEFGNPLVDNGIRNLIKSYCPVHNVSSSTNPIPNILLICAVDDENVPFWNSNIFARKLRDCATDMGNIFLHVEPAGGHHFGSKRLHVAAMELAFIIENS